jgi:ribosomal protein L37AE/L43A
MNVDPQLALIAALTMGVGYTMLASGLKKNALELKQQRRICPACGRAIVGRTCDAH